jgi:hypothetical protein
MMDRKVYTKETIDEATGLLGVLLVFMRANEESATKSKRLRASWEQKRRDAKASGTRMTKTSPAWLRPTEPGSWVVLPERAAIVHRIFKETVAGDGQHRIAERLTREGVPTWNGGKVWHRTYVRKLLENPAVIGNLVPYVTERQDGGGRRRRPLPAELVEGYYPAVVPHDLWLQARVYLAGGAPRGRHAGRAVRHLLAGLARCPQCGATMTRVFKGRNGGKPKLVCVVAKAGGECDYRSVDASAVDGVLFANWHALVHDAPPVNEQGIALREELRSVEFEEDEIAFELNEIGEIQRSRRLTPILRQRRADLFASLEVLRRTRESLQAQIVEGTPRVVSARLDRLEKALAAGPRDDLSEANQALREAMRCITVDYNAGELILKWAHGGESAVVYDPRKDFVE